jgi:DNA-directed RNA polymerase specialized sigma24 family protein
VSPGECDTLVHDCLADVAVHLIESSLPPPRSLPAYLARSLRNRVLNHVRARDRAARREAAPEAEEDWNVASCSEHAVRSSGAAPSPPSLPPALQRLAQVLESSLGGDEERLLAVWLSHCIPAQQIAAWLDIGPRTAAKRIERLRERLQLAALRYLETTDGDERKQLLIFLGRASLAPRSAGGLASVRDAEVPVP